MLLIEKVKISITNTLLNESKLDAESSAVQGFTGIKIRHLLNNLGSFSTNYLEIGVHKGATFVAANFGNSMNSYCCDNWVDFDEQGRSRKEFYYNKGRLLNNPIKVFDQSCWDLTADQIDTKIDFYLYDGPHDYEDQVMALSVIHPFLAETFIYCVDDWDWEMVHTGAREGIRRANLEVLFEQEFVGGGSDPNWWNGFYVAVLRKKV